MMITYSKKIPRELAREYGEEAVLITEAGEYRTASGRVINIADLVRRSVSGTQCKALRANGTITS